MGNSGSMSRPLRNRPIGSEKLHKSVEEVYECDFNRSSNSVGGGERGGGGGGGGPGFNFQDMIWSKPSKERSKSVICLQNDKYDQTPVYAIIPSDGTTNPTKMNVDKRTLDATSGTVAFESNQVTADEDSCLKEDQTHFPPAELNDCTFDSTASSKPNMQKRSSVSSIYVKLPPLPECHVVEKAKLCGREICPTTGGGIVTEKDMTKVSIERTDSLLNSHDWTLRNQIFNDPSVVAKYSETITGEAGSESEDVDIEENEIIDDLSILKVTMQSDDDAVSCHKEEEEVTGHGSVITDPGCDAATRDMLIGETKLADCEYELFPDIYGYKTGTLFLHSTSRQINRLKHPVASLHHLTSQPLKLQTATFSELSSPQPLPFQPSPQTPQIPPLQTSRPSSVEANRHQLHHNQVRYRVDPGKVLRVPGLVVNVPAHTNSGESYVELLWSSDPRDFLILSVDQRFLTDVLHCHLHGSTFTSPVVVTLDLPMNRGQIDVFYSPTGVDETPIWRKLRTIEGCIGRGNTRFTDGQSPSANKVLILKNRRKAVLVLRHFGSFVIVENGSVVQPREAEVAIFLQTKICDDESWFAIVKVIVGCDMKDMCRKHKSLRDKGYRLMEKTRLLLYRAESASGVEVGIRDVEWMVGCTQKQSKTTMIHGMDCLWSGMEATSLFWMTSKGSKQKEEQLTFTIYVRQEGLLEKPIGIYCDMTNDQRRLQSKPRRTITATHSSPALLKTPFKLHYEGYTTTTSPDSDLSLKTEDVSSRRHDDAISDSDQDFELNYCVTGKAIISEDVTNSKTLSSQRFSHFVEDTENVGVYQHNPVLSMEKVVDGLECAAEDMNRIIATIGGNFINQSDLDWMLGLVG